MAVGLSLVAYVLMPVPDSLNGPTGPNATDLVVFILLGVSGLSFGVYSVALSWFIATEDNSLEEIVGVEGAIHTSRGEGRLAVQSDQIITQTLVPGGDRRDQLSDCYADIP